MGLFSNWKPKTILGKVLKGATIGIGGAALAATGVGAVAGAIGGAGLLAGAAAGIGTAVNVVGTVGGTVGKIVAGGAVGIAKGTKTVLSKVSGGVAKFVTGQNKEERQLIRSVKQDAREADDKQKLIDKLIQAGASKSEAYSKAGEIYPGTDIQTATQSDGGYFSNLLNRIGMSGNNESGKTETGGKQTVNLSSGALLAIGAGLLLLPKIFKIK